MRDDYKLNGATKKIEVEVEVEVSNKIEAMEKYSKLTRSELINTAIKRFIVQHKDFLPPDAPRSSKG
jgi:metal-responsive CopG/Arc/MetJ family transcriptional regulator